MFDDEPRDPQGSAKLTRAERILLAALVVLFGGAGLAILLLS